MRTEDQNINQMNAEEQSKILLDNMNVTFKNSKSETWDLLSAKMADPVLQEPKQPKHVPYFPMAAVILLLLAFSFTRFFTRTYTSINETISFNTPDGSSVKLSPHSTASYHPLWMKFDREIKLDGKAWFHVEKGNTFKVISPKAFTQVLGTTFTIDADDEYYHVNCFTGSVSVTDNNSQISAIITANERLVIDSEGVFEVSIIPLEKKESIIKNGFLSFHGININDVFSDLASYYGVEIVVNSVPNLLYTGNLKYDENAENIIAAICLTLELQYERSSENKFIVWTE